jgi:hypothetical protein
MEGIITTFVRFTARLRKPLRFLRGGSMELKFNPGKCCDATFIWRLSVAGKAGQFTTKFTENTKKLKNLRELCVLCGETNW